MGQITGQNCFTVVIQFNIFGDLSLLFITRKYVRKKPENNFLNKICPPIYVNFIRYISLICKYITFSQGS